MLRNIEAFNMDDELILQVTTATDFEYAYRVNDFCKVKTTQGYTYTGILSHVDIDRSFIEILLKTRESVRLDFWSIEEINSCNPEFSFLEKTPNNYEPRRKAILADLRERFEISLQDRDFHDWKPDDAGPIDLTVEELQLLLGMIDSMDS